MGSPLLISPDFSAISHVEHGFFTRHIPGSSNIYIHKQGKYEELAATIQRNRAAAMQQIGAQEGQLSILRQVHGVKVITVTDAWDIAASPEADAMVTTSPDRVLGILTADCVPLLFADRTKPVIGAAHAGWKGAKAGIVESTLAAMEELGADRTHITAIIGACIHQNSYEVGPEFYDNFVMEHEANRQFFKPSSKEGHFMFDLPAYVTAKLAAAGITDIYNLERDTCREEADFFSYRRCTLRNETYGQNNLSVIRLRP
jgi:polyphenol oxidase